MKALQRKIIYLIMIITVLLCTWKDIATANPLEYYLEKSFLNNPFLKSLKHTANESEDLYRRESIFVRNPQLSFSYSNVPVSE